MSDTEENYDMKGEEEEDVALAFDDAGVDGDEEDVVVAEAAETFEEMEQDEEDVPKITKKVVIVAKKLGSPAKKAAKKRIEAPPSDGTEEPAAKEETPVKDKAKPVPVAPKMTFDPKEPVVGTIVRSYLQGIFVAFNLGKEGKRVARLIPGDAYLQGSTNLLAKFASIEQIAAAFPKDMQVSMYLTKNSHPKQIEFKKTQYLGKEDKRSKGAAGDYWTWSHDVVLMWTGAKPDFDSELRVKSDSFDVLETLDQIEIASLTPKSGEEPKPAVEGLKSFFIVHALGPHPRGPMTAEIVGKGPAEKTGTITELHRPDGGIVQTEDGTEVYFTRHRTLVDGDPICHSDVLEERLAVGDQVKVWPILNEAKGKRHVEECPAEKVAIWMQKGEAKKVTELALEEPGADMKSWFNCRVLELNKDKSGVVSMGLGVINFDENNQNSKMENCFGYRVGFRSENFCVHGVRLPKGVDLSPYLYPGAPFKAKAIPWKNRKRSDKIQFELLIGLFPPINSRMGQKVQRLVTCNNFLTNPDPNKPLPLGVLEQFAAGKPVLAPPEGFAVGRVQRFPMDMKHFGNVMSEVEIMVFGGRLHKKQFTVKNSQIVAFGNKLDKADLQYAMTDNLLVYVDVSSMDKDGNVKKVTIGPPEIKTSNVAEMTSEQRLLFLTYLRTVELSIDDFVKNLEGNLPRLDPISIEKKDKVSGIVTSICPPSSKGKSVSGIITLKPGRAMVNDPKNPGRHYIETEGVQVFFNRIVVNIFGKSAVKVNDLAMLFERNSAVSLEMTEITQADLQRKAVPLPQGVSYKATCVWFRSPRPVLRGAKKPLARDLSSFLKHKGWTEEHFNGVISGEVAGRPASEKDQDGFILTQEQINATVAMNVVETLSRNLANTTGDMMMGLNAQGQPDLRESLKRKLDSPMFPQQNLGMDFGLNQGPGILGDFHQPRLQPRLSSPTPPPRPPSPKIIYKTITEKPDLTKLPVLKHGMNVADMVEGAINASGPSDPGLDALINDDELAQKAHHISMALKFAVQSYSERRTKKRRDGFGDFSELNKGPNAGAQSSSSGPTPSGTNSSSMSSSNAALREQIARREQQLSAQRSRLSSGGPSGSDDMRSLKPVPPPAPRLGGMGPGNFSYGGVPPPSMNFDGPGDRMGGGLMGGGSMRGAPSPSGPMGMSRPMGGPHRMSAASLLGDYMPGMDGNGGGNGGGGGGGGGGSMGNSFYDDYQGGYPHPSKRSRF